jgi:hypothetical protein
VCVRVGFHSIPLVFGFDNNAKHLPSSCPTFVLKSPLTITQFLAHGTCSLGNPTTKVTAITFFGSPW